jgi:hypothetical protein
MPDPGTSSTSGGVTTVTYKDGWKDTVEPDNSNNPPGVRITSRDAQGRTRQVIYRDAYGALTSNYVVDYENDLIILIRFEGGKPIEREELKGDPTKRPKQVTKYRWDPTQGKWVTASRTMNSRDTLILTAVFLAGVIAGGAIASLRRKKKTSAPSEAVARGTSSSA